MNSVMLFIMEILQARGTELRMIDDRRCFVVNFDTFHAAYESLAKIAELYPSAALGKLGFDSFEFRASSADENPYYICTLAQPLLDNLWKEKYKPPVDAKG